MWGVLIDWAGDFRDSSWSLMLSSYSMPSASKGGTPCLLEGVVIEDRVKVRFDMVVVTRHRIAEWAIRVCWYSPTLTLALTQPHNTNFLINMLCHLHWCTEPSVTWRASTIKIASFPSRCVYVWWYILLDCRYTTMWCNVYIMQLTTELHVSTLQDHHQAYKIMVLTKAHAVILPTGSHGLQFQCTLKYSMW